MTQSPARPFLKAFACAGIGFALALLILTISVGPLAPKASGALFAIFLVPALVTGVLEKRSSAGWPLWRTIITYMAILVVMIVLQAAGKPWSAATADDAAFKARLIAEMRKGEADKARQIGAPSLLDMLQARFPDDFDTFVNKLVAISKTHTPPDPAFVRRETANLLVDIQSRYGERLKSAPTASLEAVIAAQRDLVDALKRDKPELCPLSLAPSNGQQAPSADIARGSVVRLVALLQAIADGRDKPVAARSLQTDDYLALARNAKSRGVDIGAWRLLKPDVARTAAPVAVCEALLSSLDAMLSEPGTLGERILADQAAGFLTIDRARYDDALKQ